MKQTAVEWLIDELNIHIGINSLNVSKEYQESIHTLINQAKEMEKQQIQEVKDLAFQEALKEFYKTD